MARCLGITPNNGYVVASSKKALHGKFLQIVEEMPGSSSSGNYQVDLNTSRQQLLIYYQRKIFFQLKHKHSKS